MKQVLITNDDGILGVGLPPLIKEIEGIARVVVIVPDKERSAVSHSLTLHDPVRARKISRHTYVLSGTPADCVRFGILGLIKGKISLVISGINYGPNMGNDVVYSGTVAAAREGALLEIPSFAVSLVTKTGRHFASAARFARTLAKFILKDNAKERCFFNVNVPDVPFNKIKGVDITALGKRIYDDKIHTRKDPYGLPYYWLKGSILSGKTSPERTYLQ